jgi:hypothetical protein
VDVVTTPTPAELAIAQFRRVDQGTVDIFYVEQIFDNNAPFIMGVAYPAVRNNTGIPAMQNFVVLQQDRKTTTLGHEIMHILLNSGHRDDPKSALFCSIHHDNVSMPRKRIGPYPDAAAVGYTDTRIIRSNVEVLPRSS